MRKSLRLLLAFGSCLLACAITLHAAEFQPVNPDELKMTSVKEAPGASAVVLFREEIDDDYHHNQIVYERLKVLTDAGRKYADVELPFYARYINIEGIHARTIHPDGTIIAFEGKPFEKTIVRGRDFRIKTKVFSLPDVQVGSILEYRYAVHYDDHRLMAPTWQVQRELFQRKVHFSYTPDLKHDIVMGHGELRNGISWTLMLPNKVEPQRSEIPTFHVELTMNDVPAFQEEEYMPPASQFKYHVRFYFGQTRKPEDYWKEEGKYWNKDVERFMNKTGGLGEALSKVISPSDSTQTKVRKIYDFVSKLENTTYAPQQRSTEEQLVLGMQNNRGVEDVLRQRSGDRDEIARLFVAMLREARIPAYLMWVPRRDHFIFEPQYLSTDQLDAEIAVVNVDNKELFLDPGARFCPFGILDWRHTSSRGLRQTPSGTELAETPAPDYTKAQMQRSAVFHLNEQGEIDGTMRVGFLGMDAMVRRQRAANLDDAARTKQLEDEAKSWLPGGAEVKLVNTPRWDDAEVPLIAEYQVRSPLAVSAGKRWMIPTNIFQVNETPMFPHADRTHAILLDYPMSEIDEIHILLPQGMQVESVPSDTKVTLGYAAYIAQRAQTANKIDVKRQMAMGGFAFPPETYKELKHFYDQVKAADDQRAILRGALNAQGN